MTVSGESKRESEIFIIYHTKEEEELCLCLLVSATHTEKVSCKLAPPLDAHVQKNMNRPGTKEFRASESVNERVQKRDGPLSRVVIDRSLGTGLGCSQRYKDYASLLTTLPSLLCVRLWV